MQGSNLYKWALCALLVATLHFASLSVAQEPAPGEEHTVAGIIFNWCPPGSYVRGTHSSLEELCDSLGGVESWYSDEQPACTITLEKGLWIGKYEITVKQWADVMGSGASTDCEDCPVSNVSLTQAKEFISRMKQNDLGNFRLPTEDEWEYACRAGSQQYFFFGDTILDLPVYAWHAEESRKKGINSPLPVGSKLPNVWGLHDTLGNVWEWCDSPYALYSCDAQNTRAYGPMQGHFVVRGGSYASTPANARCANRVGMEATKSTPRVGFRLVWEGDSSNAAE